MVVLFMSLVAAVVLALLSRKPGDAAAPSDRAFPRNALLAAACFGLMATMLLLAGPVMQWLGPHSGVARLDAALFERTASLANHVTAASSLANHTVLFEQAACAGVIAMFAIAQRNRFR
jgi:hypothetical protein